MVAVAPPPPPLQEVFDAAHTFLVRRGLPPAVRVVVDGIEPEPFGVVGDAAVWPTTGEVRLTPETARQIEALWRARETWEPIAPSAARIVLHEHLHTVSPTASEAHVDAVAADLTREFVHAWTGGHYRIATVPLAAASASGVWEARELSARVCGSGWRGRCARGVRAELFGGADVTLTGVPELRRRGRAIAAAERRRISTRPAPEVMAARGRAPREGTAGRG